MQHESSRMLTEWWRRPRADSQAAGCTPGAAWQWWTEGDGKSVFQRLTVRPPSARCFTERRVSACHPRKDPSRDRPSRTVRQKVRRSADRDVRERVARHFSTLTTTVPTGICGGKTRSRPEVCTASPFWISASRHVLQLDDLIVAGGSCRAADTGAQQHRELEARGPRGGVISD